MIFASSFWPTYGWRSRTRRRQEPTQTDVEDQAALDDLDDSALNDAVLFLDLLDGAPGAFVLCALLGQDQTAFLVLLLENQRLDHVTDLDDLVGVDIVLDREFAGGDDTFGLVTDVEKNLIAVNLDDDAFDDVAVVEELDGGVNRGEEVFLGADVVDRNLWCVGVENGSHKGKGSLVDRGSAGTRRGPFHYHEGFRLVPAQTEDLTAS
jgi:hypothetical protein